MGIWKTYGQPLALGNQCTAVGNSWAEFNLHWQESLTIEKRFLGRELVSLRASSAEQHRRVITTKLLNQFGLSDGRLQ